jgi:hypothetical protein
MRATGTRQARVVQPDHGHLDELLDQALADSFPASDPVAIDFSSPRDRNQREKCEGR